MSSCSDKLLLRNGEEQAFHNCSFYHRLIANLDEITSFLKFYAINSSHINLAKEGITLSMLLVLLLLLPNTSTLCAEKIFLPVVCMYTFKLKILRLEPSHVVLKIRNVSQI